MSEKNFYKMNNQEENRREVSVSSRYWWLEFAVGLISFVYATISFLESGYYPGGVVILLLLISCVSGAVVVDGLRRAFVPVKWTIDDDGTRLRISKNGHVIYDNAWAAMKISGATTEHSVIFISNIDLLTIPNALFSFDQLEKIKTLESKNENVDESG